MKPALTTKNSQGLRVISDGALDHLSKPNSHLFSNCIGVIIECGFYREYNNTQHSSWSEDSKWTHNNNEEYKLQVKVVELDHIEVTASHRGLSEVISIQAISNNEHILGKLRTQELERMIVSLRDHYKRSLVEKYYL